MEKVLTCLPMVDYYRDGRPLTLADLDAEEDFSDLDHLVEKLAGPYCTSIEFHDDNRKHGCRSLEYIVHVSAHNGRIDRDENGLCADSDDIREIIWVPVHDEMTLDQIAESVVKEVKAIDGNIFS
jgi:hypothetical protein